MSGRSGLTAGLKRNSAISMQKKFKLRLMNSPKSAIELKKIFHPILYHTN
jgi:hypothetical protein